MLPRMDSLSRKRILGEISRPTTRSGLFWWLYSEHDRITADAAGLRLNWKTLAQEFEAAGLVTASGQPPSPETARQTWKRVRKAVAAARARAAARPVTSRRAPVVIAPGRQEAPSPSPFVPPVGPQHLSAPVPAIWQAPFASAVPTAEAAPRAPALLGSDDPNLTEVQRANLRAAEEQLSQSFARRSALRRLE